MTGNVVHVVVPQGIDDPARPSGGNRYDRRMCDGLTAAGWLVHECAVSGQWPGPDDAACTALARVIAAVPDGSLALVDGLIASAADGVLVPEARRLQLVVLVHMPLGTEQERAVLSAAVAVVTTSAWTQRWLVDRYGLVPHRVHVAPPGVDEAALATGTTTGGELLCVAAVTPEKGHDVLLGALESIADRPWRCVCVGTLGRNPRFVDRVRRQAWQTGIGERVHFTGSCTGSALVAAYAAADVLVLASRAETYCMVVTEALARGLPVIATHVGGLSEALGLAADGSPPGLLVAPDDAAALAAALRRWLGDADLRALLRQRAHERRETLSAWSATSDRIADVLASAAAAA